LIRRRSSQTCTLTWAGSHPPWETKIIRGISKACKFACFLAQTATLASPSELYLVISFERRPKMRESTPTMSPRYPNASALTSAKLPPSTISKIGGEAQTQQPKTKEEIMRITNEQFPEQPISRVGAEIDLRHYGPIQNALPNESTGYDWKRESGDIQSYRHNQTGGCQADD